MEFFFEFVKGQREGYEHFKDKEVVGIGRNPENTLCLQDLGVSFDHAEIRLRNGAYWLVDRGSTNGSFVNGERAYNSKLREGDLLKFGKRGPEMRYRNRKPENKKKKIRPISDEAPRKSEKKAEKPEAASPPRDKKREKARENPVPVRAKRPERPSARLDPIPIHVAPSRLNGEGQKSSKIPIITSCALAFLFLVLSAFLWLQLQDSEHQLDTTRHKLANLHRDLKDYEKQLDEKSVLVSRYNQKIETQRSKLSETQSNLDKELYKQRRQNLDWQRQKKDFESTIRNRNDRIKTLQTQLTLFDKKRPFSQPESDRVRFQRIQKLYNSSVVLIVTQLSGTNAKGKRVNLSSSGTGFLVTRQGHIVTNKHVIEPFKFSKLAKRIATEGIVIDPKSHHVSVWLAGTRFMNPYNKRLNLATGFSTHNSTLRIHRTAHDQWGTLTVTSSGGPRKVKVHASNGNNDIAILKIESETSFKAVVPYESHDIPLQKLDPVMVLGFPLGASILEGETAETSPNMGEIRKVEDSIMIAGSMHHGNSGGPVFNSSGRVIGISTRIIGSENLGSCIKIEHALKLLGGTW